MPRIRCHYADCVFLDEGYCAAAAIELDSEEGCLTYSPSGDGGAEVSWDEDTDLEEDWGEAGFGPAGEDDDDDDDWEAGEDEEFDDD